MKYKSARPIDAFWEGQIKRHNAILVGKREDIARFPNNAVAFETLNFGFILSAKQENGFRKILLQY